MGFLRPAAILAVFALCVLCLVWIVSTSLDFQQCIKGTAEQDGTGEHFEKGVSGFIKAIPIIRHCVGAYVIDKNAVITALGTVIIAIFTAILGLFTISLSKSTRIAAEAASAAAKASLRIELPVIRAWPAKPISRKNEPFEDGARLFGQDWDANIFPRYSGIEAISFSNEGRTVAHPTSLSIGHFVGEVLPATPQYRRTVVIADNEIIGIGAENDNGMKKEINFAVNLTDAEVIQLALGHFWLFCALKYFDFLGDEHEAGFCWKWESYAPGSDYGGFARVAGLRQTYNRKT